jgi:hypothetical protein
MLKVVEAAMLTVKAAKEARAVNIKGKAFCMSAQNVMAGKVEMEAMVWAMRASMAKAVEGCREEERTLISFTLSLSLRRFSLQRSLAAFLVRFAGGDVKVKEEDIVSRDGEVAVMLSREAMVTFEKEGPQAVASISLPLYTKGRGGAESCVASSLAMPPSASCTRLGSFRWPGAFLACKKEQEQLGVAVADGRWTVALFPHAPEMLSSTPGQAPGKS